MKDLLRRQASFSLSRILMVSLLVFALVPAALGAWMLARSNLSALDHRGGKIVGDVARRVQADTEGHLAQADVVLNGLIEAQPDREQIDRALEWLARPEHFEAAAFTLTRQSPSVPYLFIGTADGQFLGVEKFKSGVRIGIRGPKDLGRRFYMAQRVGDRSEAMLPESGNYEPRTRPWYQKAADAGRRVFSPIYSSASRRQLMVTLAQPVYNSSNSLQGVVCADLYLQRLSDLLGRQSVSEHGTAYLLDDLGYLVATSVGDALYRENVDRLERVKPDGSSNPVIRASYAALKEQIFSKTKEGTSREVRIQRLQPQGPDAEGLGTLIAVQQPFGDKVGLAWTLVVAAPEADFTGALRHSLLISLIVMSALVGLAALVAYFIAFRVGRQLRYLGHSAQALGRGEVPRVARTRFAEVQILSEAMQGSALQLHDYRAQLEAHARSLEEANQTLEQRVSERTAELAASREEALAAARAKAAFLATMSHEIRTPMNGVLGMSALLDETPLNAQQRDWLKTIRVSGDQLLSVINDILDFSKIESGKLELESEPLGVQGAVEQACAIAGLKAHEKGLALKVELAPDVPAVILGDITRIRQVLINLINNAVKFTERGAVTVRVQQEPASDAPDQATPVLRFMVQDTGIGIPADRIDSLFQAFTQVDASITRKFGGTGLGLAICKRLVELMGGQIGVHSHAGEGSTFWFTMNAPIATVLTGPAASSSADPSPKGLLVLVADDNPVNLKVAAAMLGRLGYLAHTVSNGKEAVDFVSTVLSHGSQTPLGAVLMDVSMPVLDGLQATQIMIEQHGAAAPPVIAMTASILEEELKQCATVGMVGSVLKPMALDDLAQALSRWARPPDAAPTEDAKKSIASRADFSGVSDAFPSIIPGLIDLQRLQEFKDYDDAVLSMTRGVIGMFLNDVPHRLAGVEAAADSNDASALYREVHALKGAAGNVGAIALEALCGPLELASGQGEIPADVRQKLADLRACAAESAQALRQWAPA